MFIGHGNCDDVTVGTHPNCVSDADCGPNAYCPGMTPMAPAYARRCINLRRRALLTSSTGSIHGNLVEYGTNPGTFALPAKSLALGEDIDSGGWAGVGTNGGTNVAVLVNSCGFRSRYFLIHTAFMFAGVHSIFGTAPTAARNVVGSFNAYGYSDTAQWANRGAAFASAILTNPLASAADAWVHPTMVAQYVAFGPAGTSPPAPEGFNFVLSRDTTQYLAQWHVSTESWLGTQSESNDAKGNGYWSLRSTCNYNCGGYGW